MANQVTRREVMRCDDPFGIPACFYWTVDEVADWVESIGFGKYKENFRSHFINGRKLLTVDACTLPKLGIVHFGDILILAKLVRQMLMIDKDKNYDPHSKRRKYMDSHIPPGRRYPYLLYTAFVNRLDLRIESRKKYFAANGYYYGGWSMDPSWDAALVKEEAKVNKAILKGDIIHISDTKFKIGTCMQDRLLQATLRSMEKPSTRVTDPTPLPSKVVSTTTNDIHTEKYGYWPSPKGEENKKTAAKAKARALPVIKNGKKTAGTPTPSSSRSSSAKSDKTIDCCESQKRLCPILPIIFTWKKMEPTKGYPPLKREKNSICGH